MTVEEFRQGGVVVLRPQGRLDSGAAPDLERQLMSQVSGPRPMIVVDMAGIDYISSSGMRILLLAAKRAKQAGGELGLCAPQEHVLDVLKISGLVRAFRIHAAAEAAVSEMAAEA